MTEKRRSALAGILLIFLIIIGDIVSGAIGIGQGGQATSFTDQIQFDKTTKAFIASGGTFSVITNPMTLTIGEMIIVSTYSNSSAKSVTDSSGDNYTKIISISNTGCSALCLSLSSWFTIFNGNTNPSIRVTFPDNAHSSTIIASAYFGANRIGNSTALEASGGGVTNATISLLTRASGSWIYVDVNQNEVQFECGDIVAVSNLIRRDFICGADGEENQAVFDNSTALRNSFPFTGTVKWNNATISNLLDAIELVSIDSEPLNPNFNTFCTTTNGLCVTSQYAMNIAQKSTGPNSLVNIVVGTAYCTGITSTALTATVGGSHATYVWAGYNGQSRNDTGAIILIQLYVSASAPSTTFASGLCATGGSIIAVGKILFATSGATVTAYGINEYATALNGQGNLAGLGSILYSWIEITPQSVGNAMTGVSNGGSTIQYAQWGGTGHSTLSMLEIK